MKTDKKNICSGNINNNNSSNILSSGGHTSLAQLQHQALSSAAAAAASHIVTEWEDNIIFDVDDPDFCNLAAGSAAVVIDKLNFIVPSAAANMSIASVHGPQIADICSPLSHHNLGLSASLPDLVGSPLEINMDNVLTIEELRQHMGSCFTCGVSWTDDHVSLDCSECGGYSLERPCPLCDGQCGVQWKRDFAMSHACSQARWVGVCISYPEVVSGVQLPVGGAAGAATSCAAAAANQLRLAQELCSRLEQLSTSTASKSGRI
ncbi:protein pinocchio isoform X1 [Drosophila serrata]|uniref:protein pinocchio isoform X1 n=2 Tax=Drosophila serrata TaxID=7274 RepID=UPI000A1D1ABE|nr:protein pinocchio isoform X1 [Drosophila serrata]XP_020810823.1 protein pinocchio isoform X1 [Drosophila serrata]